MSKAESFRCHLTLRRAESETSFSGIRYESIADTFVQLFASLETGLIEVIREAR